MNPTLTLVLTLLTLTPQALSAQAPLAVGDAELTEMGWSPDALRAWAAGADSMGTAALIVVADGVTIVENGSTSHRFRSHSLRKSFLSALVGIAIGEGLVDTTATLADLGVDDVEGLTTIEKTARVIDLLAARSGVYHRASSETADMRAARPARGSHPAGSFWFYNNWDFNTLGTIYSDLTGLAIGDAFDERIAQPLGMEDFRTEDVEYHLEGYSRHPTYRFRISARDLARFGLMYLNRGRHDSLQIVPHEWVQASTTTRSQAGQGGTKSGYGLMWWTTKEDEGGIPAGSYTASGSGGQRLTVLPMLNIVVVHLMNTDDRDGPRIGTNRYNALLNQLLQARLQ